MLLFLVPIGTTNICREVLRLLDPCLHLYICINIQMEAQVQSFQNHKTSLLILIVQIGTKKNSALFMFFFHLDCVHITFFQFLLKLPMIDIELLPYIQLIFHMLCKKILYLDIQHALSEISMIWIRHRHCLKIEIFE